MAERQLAVDKKPGSYVKCPVFDKRDLISTTSGPTEEFNSGKLCESLSERLSFAFFSLAN